MCACVQVANFRALDASGRTAHPLLLCYDSGHIVDHCRGAHSSESSSESSSEGVAEGESLTLPFRCPHLSLVMAKRHLRMQGHLEGKENIIGRWGDGVGRAGCPSFLCDLQSP